MEIIKQIVKNAGHDLTIEEHGEWIIITSPSKEGRTGFEPAYNLDSLNSWKWYSVSPSTKVHVNNFEFNMSSYAWMKYRFGENFQLTHPC
jgi:hypothetical protein